MEVVVIPTSGNIRGEDGQLQPGVNCIKRLEAALKHGPNGQEVILAFAGGARDNPDNSEANVAARHFVQRHPDAKTLYRHVLLSDWSKYTAGDMVGLAEDFSRYKHYRKACFVLNSIVIDRIWIVAHPDHATLAARTLEHLGWNCIHLIDSGEPPPYQPWELLILKIVYRLDPTWQKIWSLPLRLLANRRGRDE